MKGLTFYRTISFNPEEAKEHSVLRSKTCLGFSESHELCISCRVTNNLLKRRKQRRSKSILREKAPLKKASRKRLRTALKNKRKECKVLLRKVQGPQKNVVEVSDRIHGSLLQVLENTDLNSVSPMVKMFWSEQQKNIQRSLTGKRWHPSMIRIALLLHSQSPLAYRTLRQTGLLQLPGETTLRDYSNACPPSQGFQPQVIWAYCFSPCGDMLWHSEI